MTCLACGWNAPNVANVSFCPNCGSDADLKSFPQAVDNSVDNSKTQILSRSPNQKGVHSYPTQISIFE